MIFLLSLVMIFSIIFPKNTLADVTISTDKPDQSCANSNAYDLADKAKTELEQKLSTVSGVINISVETCSEDDSYGVPTNELFCGVCLIFSDEEKKDEFHESTKLWGGKLKISDGTLIPICSKSALQLMSKGPY